MGVPIRRQPHDANNSVFPITFGYFPQKSLRLVSRHSKLDDDGVNLLPRYGIALRQLPQHTNEETRDYGLCSFGGKRDSKLEPCDPPRRSSRRSSERGESHNARSRHQHPDADLAGRAALGERDEPDRACDQEWLRA